MEISFLILAHCDPLQLQHLLKAIAHPGHHIWVHLDRKLNKASQRAFYEIKPDHSDVHYISRVRVQWAHISLVWAAQYLLEEASRLHPQSRYFVLLSGQDFPIKPIGEIREALMRGEARGRNFIDYHPLPHPLWKDGGWARYRRYHWHWRGHYQVTPPFGRVRPALLRRLYRYFYKPAHSPFGPLYGGWQWWAMHAEAVQHLLSHPREVHRQMQYFRYARHPEEAFYQTWLANAGLLEGQPPFSISHAVWPTPDAARPLTLNEAHFAALQTSESWFGRKFSSDESSALREKLAQEVLT